MSNARSPRDVCSTTIGTRGLISAGQSSGPLAAALGSARLTRAGCPQPALALLRPLLLRGPQGLARRGLLERDRLRLGDHEVGRLAHPQLVAEQRVAARLAKAGQDPVGRVAALS